VNEAIAGSPIPTPASISSIYKQLLAMKAARIPFKVVTGKRVYPTMVIRNLTTETDENTANNLIVTVRAQEIFLVQTQIVAAPPNNAQANPAASGSPVSNGLKLLQNAPANISGIFSSAS
jgi:hypothetical protein